MERNNYSDQFESFLKEKADEFRMYPSRRVWYSIYNNMHPGSHIPSVSMCILLLCSLFLIGYLNTGTIEKTALAETSEKSYLKLSAAPTIPTHNQPLISPAANSQRSTAAYSQTSVLSNSSLVVHRDQQKPFVNNSNTVVAMAKQLAVNSRFTATIAIGQMSSSEVSTNGGSIESANKGSIVESAGTKAVSFEQNEAIASKIDRLEEAVTTINTTLVEKDATNEQSIIISAAALAKKDVASANISSQDAPTNAAVAIDQTSHEEKEWIEQYAMYNRPAASMWKGKLSLQAYFTPAVIYRSLNYNVTDKPRVAGSPVSNGDVNDFLDNKPSFGIETGASVIYHAARRLRLKAGVQMNYTRYNAHAFQNYHPVATSLTMNDGYPYEVFATTPYTNSYGIKPVKLHNETVQLSIPFGAEFKLISIDNIEWYAGATLQPTVLLYANSYVISTDRRSYVNDPSLLNRFNVNAGFETFFTFKTNGYTWQAGPQFRTQLYSTNTKRYSVEERLMGFGFKIGVSKRL